MRGRSTKSSILKQKAQALGPYGCDWIRTNFVQVGQEALGQPGATKQIVNTHKTKVWRKGAYRRLESQSREGQPDIRIGHPDGFTYTYDATKDVYVKQHQHEVLRDPFSEEEIAGFSHKEGKEIKILGTDIVGGAEAAVVELVDHESGGLAKVWVSTSTGLDLRMEMPCPPSQDLPDLRCKTVLEWTNFRLEDIPDSVFEVPKDKIVEAPLNES